MKAANKFQHTRRGVPTRLGNVTRIAVWCALWAMPALAAPSDLTQLLRRIEARYNGVQSLKLDFSETYTGKGHPVQRESGVLFLKKPGRMRWQYTSPAGKLFLSDGRDVYLYTPDEKKAEKGKLKESEDMRAPLAFLLGKLDFTREFKSFEMRPEGGDTWITAQPKSENLAYSGVEFLATPAGEIKHVRITGQDQSKLEFAFSGEQVNVPVAADLFIFQPPPGVEVTETDR